MKKTVVITRPKEEATTLALTLRKQGYATLVAPMLTIKFPPKSKAQLKAALTQKPQLLIATSKQGISAFAAISKQRTIPIVTIGEASAEYAISLGFKIVYSAGGTANAVVAFVKKNISPAKGRLLYLRGADITVDVVEALSKAGFKMKSVTLYRAIAATSLLPVLKKALISTPPHTILFYSQRTAAVYAKLAHKHKSAHKNIYAVCMSKTVAAKLKGLPWKKLVIAAQATTEAMIDKVNSL